MKYIIFIAAFALANCLSRNSHWHCTMLTLHDVASLAATQHLDHPSAITTNGQWSQKNGDWPETFSPSACWQPAPTALLQRFGQPYILSRSVQVVRLTLHTSTRLSPIRPDSVAQQKSRFVHLTIMAPYDSGDSNSLISSAISNQSATFNAGNRVMLSLKQMDGSSDDF